MLKGDFAIIYLVIIIDKYWSVVHSAQLLVYAGNPEGRIMYEVVMRKLTCA